MEIRSAPAGRWMCERPPAGATNVAQPSLTLIDPSGESTFTQGSPSPVPSKLSRSGSFAPCDAVVGCAGQSQAQASARTSHTHPAGWQTGAFNAQTLFPVKNSNMILSSIYLGVSLTRPAP